ncbi:MAG: hypothetical protein NC826_06875, partial [Candidatus Omnitrophica bacterium]|nr:hypothetical protein [Candidatus Omnitrophota bacterium]
MRKRRMIWVGIIVFNLLVTGVGSQEVSQEKIGKITQQLQGEVIWRGKDKIAIVYKKGEGGEEEILLPIDNQTKLEHI